MNHLTPESEQLEYLERCKKATEDLKKDRPHTAEEILKMPQRIRFSKCRSASEKEWEERLMNLEQELKDAHKDERELSKKMYSLMMCVKKENTDEFMEYYESRMHEFEESLRGGAL